MLQPGRHANTSDYRYGFNGMELDNELKGEGNSYDFGARMLDPRIGRWFARDPLAAKYPELSSYNYVANNPLVYIDPDGQQIIFGIGLSGDLRKIYNSAISKMEHSGIFNVLYNTLKDHKETFIVNKIPANSYNKLMTENGDFTAARDVNYSWFGLVENQPGESSNPHTINLVPPRQSKPQGFTQSTIFEEVFHANQYMDNPSNENNLEIETEAKVAKVFQLYSQVVDHVGDMSEVLAKSRDFGISGYELKLLLNVNESNAVTGYNQNVKDYFDAIINGTAISEELESSFRNSIKELGARVDEVYKDHFNGKKFENTGNTPTFDKLKEK
jgi:RHS repeat-associated protein